MFGVSFKRAPAPAVFLTASPHAAPDKAAENARAAALAAEGMQIVHLMASSLRVDQSLATAVRFAAKHAGGAAGEELERLDWAVRLRHYASVDEGLLAFAEAVGGADPELKRALVTLQGAESEPTREGLERRLDRAYDIVVRAEERRREKLATSLERPIQGLFGVAVVLPLVLASLLPMLQLGGSAFGPIPAGAILVVSLPAATSLALRRLLARNFLGVRVADAQTRLAIAASIAVPVAGAASFAIAYGLRLPILTPPLWAAAGAATAALLCGRRLAAGAISDDQRRADLQRELPDLLHAVGAKMTAGRPAEHALLETVEASANSTLGERLRGVLFDVIVGRRSLMDAIERDDEVRQAPRVFPALRLLASTADRDTEAAGRVVMHLSEFERLRAEAAASMRTKLKSLVETTRTTTTVFAPMILGITAGMYGLLSKIGVAFVPGAAPVSGGAEGFALVVALYLAIQVALADWFAVRLISESPVSDFGRALARHVPLALALFAAAFVGSAALF